MENFDITELNKRIMIYNAWLAESTDYEALLIGNSNTFSRIALYLGKNSLDGVYLENSIQVDESLADGVIVLTAQKKGE